MNPLVHSGVKRLIAGLLALLALTGGDAARAQDALQPVLARAMAGTPVPAMGMAVLRDGRIDAIAVRGLRVAGGSYPVLPGDPWHIGSDAKAMTAVLIARLVEHGVFAWDDRVAALLPDLAATMQPQYAHARLIDLLTHRAGLPHDLIDPAARAALFGDAAPDTLTDKRRRYIARALTDPPVGRVGAFHYSNTGYLIAAAIAERATGESYETLLQREVLGPLGMAHTRFGTTVAGEPQGHRDGTPRDPADTNPLFFAPAGALVLPLDDWARFCLDQLAGARGQGRLLSPSGYRRMQRNPDGATGYGMGWEVMAGYAGQRGPALSHAGSDTNWYAIAVLFPRTGTGVLVTANAGVSMAGDAVARAALALIVPELQTDLRQGPLFKSSVTSAQSTFIAPPLRGGVGEGFMRLK